VTRYSPADCGGIETIDTGCDQWHLLKPEAAVIPKLPSSQDCRHPKTAVIPALSRDPVGVEYPELTGFPFMSEMSKQLVLLNIAA
jgi:hypothetical protein